MSPPLAEPTPTRDRAARLVVHDIRKSFPGVMALRGVSFDAAAGEVLAVIGENGAGKSTLMKILAGVQRQDEGTTYLDGAPLELRDVRDAIRHGITLIHQELNLADNLSVGANLFLGREPRRGPFVNQREIHTRSAALLARVGLRVDPDRQVGTLSIGEQQLVEIARSLSIDARVVIMDEPTSSLTQRETDRLFEVIRRLRSDGVTVVYISHRLSEVTALADRVVVLRDGEKVGELAREDITHDRMVRLMVGRELSQFYDHTPHPPGEVLLSVEGLQTAAHPGVPVTLSICQGEIVGLAGLVGAGRSELLRAIFGAEPSLAGTVRVDGAAVDLGSPRGPIAAGIALVPEDRKSDGLILPMSVRENVGLAGHHHHARYGFLNKAREEEIADRTISRLQIRARDREHIVRELSGGNQQKVVLGRWLDLEPRVLLLDEPTRGVDIGAKQEIYRLMEELSTRGCAILFASSEMEEVIGMSDRALVMHDGRIAGELRREDLSEQSVMALATDAAGTAGVAGGHPLGARS